MVTEAISIFKKTYFSTEIYINEGFYFLLIDKAAKPFGYMTAIQFQNSLFNTYFY